MRERSTVRSVPRVVALSVLCGLVVAGLTWGVLTVAGRTGSGAAPGAPVDLLGNVVVPDDVVPLAEVPSEPHSAPPTPSGTPTAAPDRVPDGRLVIDAVGLDVPLEPMVSAGGEITPPGFDAAYWVSDIGVGLDDAASGTVYVAMHSLRRGGVAPGNLVIDVPGQTAAVAVGDEVRADGVGYVVEQWLVVTKAALPDERTVWEQLPGRLLLITCLQNPQATPSENNLVVIARRVP